MTLTADQAEAKSSSERVGDERKGSSSQQDKNITVPIIALDAH